MVKQSKENEKERSHVLSNNNISLRYLCFAISQLHLVTGDCSVRIKLNQMNQFIRLKQI